MDQERRARSGGGKERAGLLAGVAERDDHGEAEVLVLVPWTSVDQRFRTHFESAKVTRFLDLILDFPGLSQV